MSTSLPNIGPGAKNVRAAPPRSPAAPHQVAAAASAVRRKDDGNAYAQVAAAINAVTASLKADVSKPIPAPPTRPAPAPAPTSLTLTSTGLSDAPGIGPTAAQRRVKSDAALEARREALPPLAKTWLDVLTIGEVEALAAVGRLYARGGGNGVSISRGELAAHLSTTPDEAGRLLDRLVEVGAVIRTDRLMDSPVFKPAPWTPPPAKAVTSQKSDGAMGETAMSRAFATARFAAGLGVRAR